MYKQCLSEPSARRQRVMEQTLMDMMLRMRYEQITVSSLCQELDIPRKAFYRYFSGKDGALYAMLDHKLMDFMERLGESGISGMLEPLEYMLAVCRYWQENKALLDALAQCGMSGVLIQRAMIFSREADSTPHFLKAAEKQLQDYGAMFATCGIMTMIIQWHADGYSQSVEQMATLLLKLLSKPLFDLTGADAL